MDQTTEEVSVTIEEEDDGFPIWVIVVIIVILLAVIIIVVVVIFVKGKGGEKEEPTPMEQEETTTAPDIEQGQEEPVEYETQQEPNYEEIIHQTDIIAQEVPVQEVSTQTEMPNEEEVGACPNCGAPLGPYDTKCANCGVEFEVEYQCPNCGTTIIEGSEN